MPAVVAVTGFAALGLDASVPVVSAALCLLAGGASVEHCL